MACVTPLARATDTRHGMPRIVMGSRARIPRVHVIRMRCVKERPAFLVDRVRFSDIQPCEFGTSPLRQDGTASPGIVSR